MRRVAYILRFYPGLSSIIDPSNGVHLRLLEEVIPNVRARERLENNDNVTKDNVKSLILLAYDDPELAEKMENKFLLANMTVKK
jgi:hypothetical protein